MKSAELHASVTSAIREVTAAYKHLDDRTDVDQEIRQLLGQAMSCLRLVADMSAPERPLPTTNQSV